MFEFSMASLFQKYKVQMLAWPLGHFLGSKWQDGHERDVGNWFTILYASKKALLC